MYIPVYEVASEWACDEKEKPVPTEDENDGDGRCGHYLWQHPLHGEIRRVSCT